MSKTLFYVKNFMVESAQTEEQVSTEEWKTSRSAEMGTSEDADIVEETYIRWCGRTVDKIIIYLLPDSAIKECYFCFPDDCTHVCFGNEFIISPKTKSMMQLIGQFSSFIGGDVTAAFGQQC